MVMALALLYGPEFSGSTTGSGGILGNSRSSVFKIY